MALGLVSCGSTPGVSSDPSSLPPSEPPVSQSSAPFSSEEPVISSEEQPISSEEPVFSSEEPIFSAPEISSEEPLSEASSPLESSEHCVSIVSSEEPETSEVSSIEETVKVPNITTTVYETGKKVSPVFSGKPDTYELHYDNDFIRIEEDGTVIGLKGKTSTQVTLTTSRGLTTKFKVVVSSSTYAPTSTRDNLVDNGTKYSETEGWFTPTDVSEVSAMGSDFMNGIDISSCYALYQNGTRFYNKNGYEQSLFYILKDAGVNWIRLKLWVDPKTADGVSYGGGESNLANTLWMAREAKLAGLKLLLDFHYSDFWAHPAQQILPKSWNDCTSKDKLLSRIRSYTAESLTAFKDNGCLPDMVQLGNEISSGIFLQQYTGTSETFSEGEPSYLREKTEYAFGTRDTSEYADYMIAAANGVKDVDSKIKKVIHWAKGSRINSSVINGFFANMPEEAYDYAGISFYPYYCFDSMDGAYNLLSDLDIAKPWFIAETSYPFSGGAWVYEGQKVFEAAISNWTSGLTDIKSKYPFTAAGQANLIHDLTETVVECGGTGIFYWEGAWVPNAKVGWAGQGSHTSWSNQGFFSLDGKVMPNIDLFQQMSPHF